MSKIQVVFDLVGANEKVDFSAVKYRLTNNHTTDGITWTESTQSAVEDSPLEKLTQTVIIDTEKAKVADVEAIIAKYKKEIGSVTVVSNEPYVEKKAALAEEKKAASGKSAAVFDLFALYDGVDFAPVAAAVLALKADGVTFDEATIIDIMDGSKLQVKCTIDNTKTSAEAVEKLFQFPDDVDGIVLVSETPIAEAKVGNHALVFDLFALYDGVDFAPVAAAVLALKADGVTFDEATIIDIMDGSKLQVKCTIDNTKTSAEAVEKLFQFPDDVDGIVLVSETPIAEAKVGNHALVFDLFALYDGVDFAPVAAAVLALKADGVTFQEANIVEIMDGSKLQVKCTIDISKTSAEAVEKLFQFPDDVDGVVLVSETAL